MGFDDRAVTISVASRDEVSRRAVAAFGGERRGSFISFATADLLWQTLTRERWDLLKALAGQLPRAVDAVAADLGRSLDTVHEDAEMLCRAGIIDREGDRLSFPFDTAHADFTLRAAA